MIKIETFLRTAQTRAWGAAAALVLGGASGAVAGTGIDVPPQAFDHGEASSRPVAAWRPNPSSRDRSRSDGRRFGVNVPVGPGARLPLTVRLLSSEAQCHDEDITSAAEEQDGAFIRDGADRTDNFSRGTR